VAVAGANAADLPSKKAAPVNYVKVCDAYGAGFYTIPGTDTCIKVGGRVRADFAMTARQDVYASNVIAPVTGGNIVGGYYYTGIVSTPITSTASSTNYGPVVGTYTLGAAYGTNASNITATNGLTQGGFTAANGVAGKASNIYGWEARSRVDVDARTATAYGTVQAVGSLRMARTTGVLDQVGPAQSASSAGATLEAAYIRFAGFTFGVAKDNFSFMPSIFYGAGHWSSFANGAKQIAYTAVLGGGFSATLGIQDASDTTLGGVNALGTVASSNVYAAGALTTTAGNGFLVSPNATADAGAANGTVAYSYKSLPQINGRLDFDQAWGTVSAMGAVGQAVGVNSAGTYDKSKNIYAVGAGVKFNVPQLAAGDALWLNGGYANGMTEYTTNWTSFKSSDTKRNVGGYVTNHPSWIVTSNGIETLKSWNVAGVFQHFWAPTWRHAFLASYGSVQGTTTSKSLIWSQTGAFGDAKVWNVGTQLAWLPTKDFEIGVDVLYARVAQDILRAAGTTTNAAGTTVATGTTISSTSSTREAAGNWTGRLRVERTF
jgi:hypothetical protein